MSEAGYQVTHIDQIPEPPGEKEEGERDWHAVRIHFGIQSFGVNAYTATQEGRDRRRARRGRHEARGALLRLHGERDVHRRRRDGGGSRRHLRLRARSGVDPLGRRARDGDDRPLPRGSSRRDVRSLGLGAEVRPGIVFVTWSATLSLAGAGGEPVDLWRTIMSHGVADLPPNRIDEEARTFETTVAVPRGRPQTVIVREGRGGKAALTGTAGKRSEAVLDGVRHILRIDEDLSEFYTLAAEDPDLLWVTQGAGRLLRSQTVYEDVVKTICTTNTAWSGTVRMVSAIVEHLGEPAAGAPPDSPFGRAFPSPAAMAAAPESFYRDVARSGYRGAYLRSLAQSVASGEVDLEELATADPGDLPDDEVAARLLALPGVGPYAAAHIMMLIGRYSRLVLDSWTRPKYASLNGRKAKDTAIERRFRRYGRYSGLAFWLFLTRDWVAEPV